MDDHELLAQLLVRALREEGLDAERAESTQEDDVIDAVWSSKPELVLLDLHLESGSSLPLVAPVRSLGASVVMVTGEEDRTVLAECVEAGASGFVLKSSPFGELVSAITVAAGGGALLGCEERDQLLSALRRRRSVERSKLEPFERLTPREASVLQGLVRGESPDTIAEESFVALTTVRSQIRSIHTKLGVTSQLAAVAMARSSGWQP